MLDYESLTVRDLKRIVNREEATPAAIGLFVAYDAWRHTKHIPHIITNELLRWIEDKWRFRAFANELDYWISLGELLTQIEAMIAREKLGSLLVNVALYTEIFSVEGSLYAAAFSAAYEQAAAASLKLKLPGLSASQVELLATRATEKTKLRLTPPKQMRELEGQVQGTFASLLALRNAMNDLATLLGVSALAEEMEQTVDSTDEQMDSHRTYVKALEPLAPKWAKQINGIIAYEHTEPNKETEDQLGRMISLYLTPKWKDWARAGVNLRELADSSKSIVDLIRLADSAAAELNDER